MERSFKKEVQALKLGDGETFRGEGILAVTKALLQSGVAYVGGYQGAPVSHLLDVLVDAEDLLAELGVHLETCTNEASAAAMLGASINYPLRGAVTWKSIVGTNVAADALSNLSSPGVIGGALIIVGEDYGEGASVIQERTHAYALKSSMWLLDPRPDLPTIVRMVEKGFELSEATNTPVMLELRIRACHVTGEFAAKDNRKSAYLRPQPHRRARRASTTRGCASAGDLRAGEAEGRGAPAGRARLHPRAQAQRVVRRRSQRHRHHRQGGLTNSVLRALERLGLADVFGASRIPMLVLNVVYPLVPEEIREFCAGKRAVLIVEEGAPDYIEQAVNVELRRADIQTRVLGKDALPMAGEYTAEVVLRGPRGVPARRQAERPRRRQRSRKSARPDRAQGESRRRARPAAAAAADLLHRLPGAAGVLGASSCCSARSGPTHISADIGCHSFATFAPFSWAIRSSATACRSPAPPRSRPTWTSARSPSWATAASGTTG